MNAQLDYDLTPNQWEALKALRTPARERYALDRFVLDQLIVLELAMISDCLPRITARGRSVLLRGSPRLLDVAA
jgi:hypothetical protein